MSEINHKAASLSVKAGKSHDYYWVDATKNLTKQPTNHEIIIHVLYIPVQSSFIIVIVVFFLIMKVSGNKNQNVSFYQKKKFFTIKRLTNQVTNTIQWFNYDAAFLLIISNMVKKRVQHHTSKKLSVDVVEVLEESLWT